MDLLLATYNGARHLGAQLDSLLAQTHQDFRLLVSDDGSTDGTLALLESYRARFGGRLVLVPNAAPGRGTVRNFENLMQSSLRDAQAGWAAFCDQDDVWLPRKIEATLSEMQRLEARTGEGACVVHSDLVVVDEALNVIHPSFVRHQRFDPGNCTADMLLSINQVTGCAMMVNRALLQAALPLPAAAVMHDWWCALLAGSGHRSFLDEPLVLYRQHGANQLGAKGRTLRNRLARLAADATGVLRRVRALGQATRAQALALRERLDSLGRDGGYVEDYLSWRGRPLWRRLGGHRRYYAGPALDRCSRLLFW
ncbi:glycosyltransferase family 2 protein [Acidovorax sp. SDU_ACID1]|uniref:glycosyltransferase family 2 protein n=1 Tax=Acidovorax sp. SDU_ACID1 TaxID=3136632 RepID=UPI003872BE21